MQKLEAIRLQLLGKFRIYCDGDPASSIRISARKGCALLAYLAMHPERSVSRSQLATLLWADRPDKQARHSLRQCLTSLRADLAPFAPDMLHLEGDTVELRLPAAAIDATALVTLAESSELSELMRAGDLYRGAFLADVDLGVETFDAWAHAERARLEAIAARIYEACAEGFDGAGLGGPALEAAERLIALDPLREDWQRILLRLMARYRGREAALARAESLATLLKGELEVAPSTATLTLIDEIRRCKPAPAAPIVINGPVAPAAREAVPDAAAPAPVAALSRRRLPGLAALSITAVLGLSGWLALHGSASSLEWAGRLRGGPADSVPTPANGFLTLAVLPFTADGKDGATAAYADKMTANLIDEISRTQQVRAISDQASQHYRGRTTDITTIGAELGVRYIAQGHIDRQDDRLQVSMALIDADSRLQVWAERLDDTWRGRDAAGGRIARGLARVLALHAVAAEARWAARQNDPGITGLLAEGWAAIQRHNTAATTGNAQAYFEEVLRRDPDNVSALIGMGAEYAAAVSNLYIAEQEPSLTRAETFLNRAITLSPEAAGAYYWLGVVQKVRGQRDDALRSFTRAQDLSPSFAPAYAQAGHIEGRGPHPDEGLAKIRYAIALDPEDPAVGRWSMFAGQIEIERGNFDAATGWLLKSVEIMPRNLRTHASLAAAYALAGNMKAAAREATVVKKLAAGGGDPVATSSVLSFMGGPRAAPLLFEGWHKALDAS